MTFIAPDPFPNFESAAAASGEAVRLSAPLFPSPSDSRAPMSKKPTCVGETETMRGMFLSPSPV